MPRNGSGQYSLPSGNPVVTNTVISSSGWANPTLTDIGAAITDSIAADGQTIPSANLPMGNFRHTGVANAQNRTDYAAAGQVQDSVFETLANVLGTDTITATTAPPITAYTAGQRFKFMPAGSNATTTVTLNINSLGAKSVLKPTQAGLVALAVGDIQSGVMQTVIYDGTQFQLETPGAFNPGRLINIQQFTSSGTYTKTPGANNVRIRGVAPGGGSGGTGATTGAQSAAGQSSGAGAYAEVWAPAPATATITVGAAGAAGGAGGNGATGGTSSFVSSGVNISLPGGTQGLAGGAVGTPAATIPSGPTATPTISGATLVVASIAGQGGATSMNVAPASSVVMAGSGGSNPLGFGGVNGVGTGYGAGACAQTAGVSSAAKTGFAGLGGIWIIEEYA